MPADPLTPGTRLTPSIDAGLLSAVGGGAQLHELSITRFFDFPRERVFEAFTNPNHARHWMGPRGSQATYRHLDARPGGKWRAMIHQTDSSFHGRVIPDLGLGGEFKEVVPPERLVYSFAWEGQAGQPTRETVITIRLTEVDGSRTKMDMHQAFFDKAEHRDDHNQGWNSSFDRLDEYLQQMVA